MMYALVVFVLAAPGVWIPHPEFLTFNTLQQCEEAAANLVKDESWKGIADGLMRVKCIEYDSTKPSDQFILDIQL